MATFIHAITIALTIDSFSDYCIINILKKRSRVGALKLVVNQFKVPRRKRITIRPMNAAAENLIIDLWAQYRRDTARTVAICCDPALHSTTR